MRRACRREPAVRHGATRPTADVVTPTLGIMGRERVTITDYKSSDVRDPAKARQRARDSLQLQIYAMGYEAMTGRLPDQVALHFLDSGLVGQVDVDPKRVAKARDADRDGGGRHPRRTLRRHAGPDGLRRAARSATSVRRAWPGRDRTVAGAAAP